jgi:hypothetical protein
MAETLVCSNRLIVRDSVAANKFAEPLETGIVLIARDFVGRVLGQKNSVVDLIRELDSGYDGGEFYAEPDYAPDVSVSNEVANILNLEANKMFSMSDFAADEKAASFFWHPISEGEVVASWHLDALKDQAGYVRVVSYLGNVHHELSVAEPMEVADFRVQMIDENQLRGETTKVKLAPGDAFIMNNSPESRIPHRLEALNAGFRMICILDFVGPFSTLDLRVPEDL